MKRMGESGQLARQAKIILGLVLALICGRMATMTVMNHKQNPEILKVGFPFSWGNLTPALQHTAYADTIIKNQFESLVRSGVGGKIEPLAALSWTVSSDYRVFTFQIDASRKFSDGTPLTALDFKNAWEQALALQPKSANSSLQDLLYKVEGYEDFENSKKLSGLIAKGETLEIHFKSPFRMALDRLCGGRFGVFQIRDGKYFGTGSYVIEEKGVNSLVLTRNPFSNETTGFSKVEVNVIDPKQAEEALLNGTVDIYAAADAAEVEACQTSVGNIDCLAGDEVAHSNLDVNGLSGRFFSNSKYRLALQALISQELPKVSKPRRLEINQFQMDPQVFLPVQAGRIAEDEVEKLIAHGNQHLAEFIRATEAHPLYYVSRHEKDWIFEFLKSKGIKFTENSGKRDFKTLLEMSYKTNEPDLLLMGRSVASGDPDGIYHMLGEHGAILSHMVLRSRVAKLLEEGRAILDASKINEHYQKVTRAILEDVPFVHLGFDIEMLAYRKDRVRVSEKVRNRKQFHFHIFEPK